jgi:signal transduction histidine kinase
VDLRALITKIAQDHVIEAKLRKVNMTTRSQTEGLFEVDADLVGRVVENLIENGLRYTRPRGNLLVVTTDEGTHLEIRVANDGPPIPDAARAHIFEKYGQAQTPGATRINRGLGLYFCRVAAEAHGGTIALVDEPSMTTCFCLRLPRHLFAH